MLNVKVRVDNEALLSRIDRLFDKTPKSFLLEMFQNFRRAGATKIDVQLKDDKLTISGDGKPLDDFQLLFSLGESGWKKEETINEDPAGMGFFSACMFNKTEVHSNGKMCVVTSEDLKTLGSEIKVLDSEIENTTFVFYTDGKIADRDIREAAEWFPIPVFINGSEIARFELEILIHEDENYKYYDYHRLSLRSADTFVNFHGHLVSFVLPYSLSYVLRQQNYNIVAVPKPACKLKMVLPARNAIVEDEEFHKLQEGMYTAIAKVKSGTKMAFKDFVFLRKHYPEMESFDYETDNYLFVISNICLEANHYYLFECLDGEVLVVDDSEMGFFDDEGYELEDLEVNGTPFSDLKFENTLCEHLYISVKGKYIGEVDHVVAGDIDTTGDDCGSINLYYTKDTTETDVDEFVDYILDNYWEANYEFDYEGVAQRADYASSVRAFLCTPFKSDDALAIEETKNRIEVQTGYSTPMVIKSWGAIFVLNAKKETIYRDTKPVEVEDRLEYVKEHFPEALECLFETLGVKNGNQDN